MLKTPTVSSHSNPYVKNGTAYAYIDSSVSSLNFVGKDISGSTSPLARTENQAYDNSAEATFMYSDQTPNGSTSTSSGHTKGVIAYKRNQGFWLVHSTPRFPPEPPNAFSFPDTGRIYGQSYICLSLGFFHPSVSLT
jgi:deoxyribonuclease-2